MNMSSSTPITTKPLVPDMYSIKESIPTPIARGSEIGIISIFKLLANIHIQEQNYYIPTYPHHIIHIIEQCIRYYHKFSESGVDNFLDHPYSPYKYYFPCLLCTVVEAQYLRFFHLCKLVFLRSLILDFLLSGRCRLFYWLFLVTNR